MSGRVELKSGPARSAALPRVLARVAVAVASALALPGAAFSAQAGAAAPAFSARVEHEIVRIQANGITRIERWQESVVRDGNTVWVERLLPEPAAKLRAQAHAEVHGHDHDHDHHHDDDGAHAPGHAADRAQPDDRAGAPDYRGHGHRHFDGDAAARWIERGPDNKVSLSLVDRQDRVVVSIPQAEFRTMGFDGRFDAAASLVPATVIATMATEGGSGSATVPGKGSAGTDTAADTGAGAARADEPLAARWLVDHNDGWVHRVLWSDTLQLALQIDSRRDDGSLTRQVKVTLERLATPGHPWDALGAYERKRYDEYLD